MSLRNKRTLYPVCIKPVKTYACPVFAHTAPTALCWSQVIWYKIFRRATETLYFVRNSVLHGDLEFPTISKCMKYTPELSFSIAVNHPNPFMFSVTSYEAPLAIHSVKRSRNVLKDSLDDLTAERHSEVPTHVEASRDSLRRRRPSGSREKSHVSRTNHKDKLKKNTRCILSSSLHLAPAIVYALASRKKTQHLYRRVVFRDRRYRRGKHKQVYIHRAHDRSRTAHRARPAAAVFQAALVQARALVMIAVAPPRRRSAVRSVRGRGLE
ncbi:hypothetical protein EVAR_35819_1 [Eumeta japonica]|uniref:Uncharacterized protein n=1 Tax=Eumeta variegata TaxID=151549 RepID=A0A4C1WZX1_EUMVA|nr:hypothetical protein EVAR_35819_1 [Eumeta japonica]